MIFNNRENKCYDIDGKEIWHSRSVAVVGMIIMIHLGEKYVLMGKRGTAMPNEVGKWCMPCGFLDWDETTEEGIARELWEEAGFNVDKALFTYNTLQNNMNFPWRINSVPDNEAQNISMHYAAVLSTVPNIQHDLEELPHITTEHNPEPNEVEEIKWVRIDELWKYDCAFGHDSVINIYVNSLDI